MKGLPESALDELVKIMAQICENPYDALTSLPSGNDICRRWASFGPEDDGFVEFVIDETAHTVTIIDLSWVG